MNNEPLLSICIPTYNRSKYLKRSIDSIITQKEFLNGSVEIVISDNASTDDTEEVVRPYLDKYKNIYYFRNTENVVDRNFPIVLSRANGVLRRLCNDTQCFYDGSLNTICKIVLKYQHTRPYICWANGQARIEHASQDTNFKEYVRQVSFWMTSSTVFSIWGNECKNLFDDLSGCSFHLWQTKKSLELASNKNSVLICNQKMSYIQTVAKKDISYGLFHVFFENYFSILKPYFESGILSNEVKEYLEKDLLFGFYIDWVAKWELQPANLDYSKTENLKKAVWNAYKDKPYWREFLCRYYIKLYYMKTKQLVKRLLGRE